jgi:sulfur-oxidizing protein SoxZ
MNTAARIRARHRDGITDVMVLLLHPMETGLRTDASGRVVPADYISIVRVRLGVRVVLEAQMTIAVSKDPLLSFRFRGGQSGDVLVVEWTDNHGSQQRQEEAIS